MDVSVVATEFGEEVDVVSTVVGILTFIGMVLDMNFRFGWLYSLRHQDGNLCIGTSKMTTSEVAPAVIVVQPIVCEGVVSKQ